jgi:hypothetical protein
MDESHFIWMEIDIITKNNWIYGGRQFRGRDEFSNNIEVCQVLSIALVII